MITIISINLSVLTIGEILFDVFESHKHPGGSSMNVALHLHKQGVKTHFTSAIGNDENYNTNPLSNIISLSLT